VNQILKASSVQLERIDRVAVLSDGASLYAASRTLGFDVDYKNLLEHFQQQSYLVRAYYYIAILETEEYSPIRPLVDWLGYTDYSVVTKPAKEFIDATGRRRVKGSVDIEMAVDVLDLTSYLDRVVIFSGDDDLRRQVDAFVDLANVDASITRAQVGPRQRAASASSRPAPIHATPAEPLRNMAGLSE
jgi:uncharacterized LabA/DUF88 family protein